MKKNWTYRDLLNVNKMETGTRNDELFGTRSDYYNALSYFEV